MTKEETIKELNKVIECLNDVDCFDITEMRNNAKKIHKAYDLLGLLKEKIVD